MVLESTLIALFLQHFTLPESTVRPSDVQVESQQGFLTATITDTSVVSSIARGSQRVPMLSLSLTASCATDIPVYSLALRRTGLGFNADIARIYAESNGQRLTRGTGISNRDGRVQLQLRRFSVPACETEHITIYADYNADAALASEHRIVLDGSNPVEADNARVLVNRSSVPPVRKTSGGLARGTITVSYLNVTSPIRFGRNRIVSRLRLEADRTGTQILESIRFTNKGSAKNDDLQNLVLTSSADHELTHVVQQMSDDEVVLTFNPPLRLTRGQQRTFVLRADVMGGIRKSVQFVIEEPSDIIARSRRGRF